jgi:hypothetical protein
MKFAPVVLALGFFLCSSAAAAQLDSNSVKIHRRSNPWTNPGWVIAPLFASGMKCDGVNDDAAALQTILDSAARSGLGTATVIMPPGVCIINIGARVHIRSSVWLRGSGKFATVLKRMNSSNGNSILWIQTSGVTLSDFTIDGNQGGSGIATPAEGILATTPLSNITIRRMRFLNATQSDIVSSVEGLGHYTINWTVEDNDFQNQGNSSLPCYIYAQCANVRLLAPLHVRISRNRSDHSLHFALFSSIPGGGQVEVGDNIVTDLDGFGVALGGGTLGAASAHIHHNFVSTTTTDHDNLIDVASWNDFNVDHNYLLHNGVSPSPVNQPSACIADFPPANHGIVDANICYAVPTVNLNVVGISMGGNDISISNNFVQDCGTAGIGVAVGSQGPARGIRIIGNTAKNNSHQSPGFHAGIELFLGPGAPDLAALSDVIIQDNHAYDDQPVQTQGYGIGIGLAGVRTRYNNILVEGNNIVGNKVGGFHNAASQYTGFAVRHNAGLNPVGPITAPAVPTSGTAFVNNSAYDVDVYITSSAQPVTIAINGATITGVTVPGGGAVSTPIRLPTNQSITLTYTGGPPTWQWVAD